MSQQEQKKKVPTTHTHKEEGLYHLDAPQQQESSNTGDNLKSILIRKNVKNTPFTLVTTEEGTFVAVANYTVSEMFKTEEEAEADARSITWDRIMQIITILHKIQNEN